MIGIQWSVIRNPRSAFLGFDPHVPRSALRVQEVPMLSGTEWNPSLPRSHFLNLKERKEHKEKTFFLCALWVLLRLTCSVAVFVCFVGFVVHPSRRARKAAVKPHALHTLARPPRSSEVSHLNRRRPGPVSLPQRQRTQGTQREDAFSLRSSRSLRLTFSEVSLVSFRGGLRTQADLAFPLSRFRIPV